MGVLLTEICGGSEIDFMYSVAALTAGQSLKDHCSGRCAEPVVAQGSSFKASSIRDDLCNEVSDAILGLN